LHIEPGLSHAIAALGIAAMLAALSIPSVELHFYAMLFIMLIEFEAHATPLLSLFSEMKLENEHATVVHLRWGRMVGTARLGPMRGSAPAARQLGC